VDLQRRPLRGLSLACALLAGCGGAEDPLGDARRWQEDPTLRRTVLEDALVRWDNGYARLRIERYTETEWGARPVWRPRVAPAQTGTTPPDAFELAVDEGFRDEAALVALGEAAFARYPVQLVPELRAALADPEACGLEVEGSRVRGVVWVALPDGPQPALTCAACHAEAGVPGRANHRFDLSAVLAGRCGAPSPWGPGRVDVTADGVTNPTAIPDLRPVRWQAYLHRAGTVANGPLALAMRTETLIITSLSSAVRPPREVALGLSWWMRSLADDLPAPPPDREAEALFDTHCGTCHAGPGRAGGLVPLDEVATDRAVLESPDRGTGFARVPALRGLADRRPLFAGGAAPDLAAWWSGAAPVPGHPAPEALEAPARARLGAYLATF
jgi:hypothetical protein